MLIRNVYVRVGSNLIRGGLSMIASILIVRTLGVDVIGQIGYYYGLVGMLTLFEDMGAGAAYLKFMTMEGPHEQDVSCYALIKAVLIGFTCLLIGGGFAFFFHSPSFDRTMFFVAFLVTVIDLISQFFSNTLSGRRDFIFLSKVDILGAIALFIYNILLCLFFPDPYYLALNMGIAPLCLILAGGYYFMRHDLFPFERPKKETLKKYIRYAYPISFLNVMGLFTGHFEKVLLGRLIGMKELGYYRLALGVFSGIDKLIKPVTSTLFTELSYRVNQSADFIRHRFTDLVETLNMTAGLLSLLLAFFSAPGVILFYGAENLRTAVILQFFILLLFSRMFWRPYRHILYALEAHHPLGYLSVLEFCLRLGCYYLLIPLSVKGFTIGAIGILFTEFILWILPSGIYNVVALRNRLGSLHIMKTLSRAWLPLGALLFMAFLLDFRLYLLPVFLVLYLALEWRLSVLTRERWRDMVLPLRGFLGYSKARL